MQEGIGTKQKKRKQRQKKKNEKRKRIVLITKENDRCASFGPSIYMRVSLFIIQKLTQFFTLTLYKSYCLGLFTCEPSIVLGRYKSCPYNSKYNFKEFEMKFKKKKILIEIARFYFICIYMSIFTITQRYGILFYIYRI